MNVTKFLVSLVAVMSLLLVTVSATDIASVESVKINGIYDTSSGDISVVAGDQIPVTVVFMALENASDVKMKVTLESKTDSTQEVIVGDVEAGKRYTKNLNLRVPYDLKDDVSNDLNLALTIWNGDFKTEYPAIVLRVQRPSYTADVLSIETSQTVTAGESMPVDVVLRNVGYNDLSNLYVTAKITALGVQRTSYFGDLVAVESNDEDNKETDTVRGRIFLELPYGAAPGIYNLEVEVKNSDMTMSKVKQIAIANDFAQVAIKSGSDLILVNPTNKIKVYTVNPDSPAMASQTTVVVPAGSSKTVRIDPNGAQSFKVNVLSGTTLVGTVDFAATDKTNAQTSPAMILIVVLTIVFVVLLAVLVVLMTRKPAKEEFGESYY